MTKYDAASLAVPLCLLGLIILADIFFSRAK